MHELSLCRSIIAIVKKNAPLDGRKIKKIKVVIGELVAVDVDSLQFWFAKIANEYDLLDVTLVIEIRAGLAACLNCKERFYINSHLGNCSSCGSDNYEIVEGDEFFVEKIEVS